MPNSCGGAEADVKVNELSLRACLMGIDQTRHRSESVDRPQRTVANLRNLLWPDQSLSWASAEEWLVLAEKSEISL